MAGTTKLMTSGGGGVNLTPASSIASDVTVNVPSQNCTLGIQGPAVSAYSLTQQTINNSTTTKITFDLEEYDTASCFSSSKFTPNVAGYYNVIIQLRFDSNINTNSTNTSVYKNGSEWIRLSEFYSSGGGTKQTQMNNSVLVYLNGSTDYLEVYATANTTGSNMVMGYNDFRFANHFQAALVRAA